MEATDQLPERIVTARSRAAEAILEAERLERQALLARRRANGRLRHYERLLREYQGEQALPFP